MFFAQAASVTSYDPKFVKTADDVIPVTHLETLEAFLDPTHNFGVVTITRLRILFVCVSKLH